jgi:hypothetical protein
MQANKSLERTVGHRARTVRAVALCARAGAQWRRGRPFNGIVSHHELAEAHIDALARRESSRACHIE